MIDLLKYDEYKIFCRLTCLIIVLLCLVTCRSSLSDRLASIDDLPQVLSDLQDIRVALFWGTGMSEESALAAGRAFQWMCSSVELVDADCIKNGCLNNFDILVYAGGESRPDPWSELGNAGKTRINEFVMEGGGFLGICFGAGYASHSWYYWGEDWRAEDKELYLNLFNGVAYSGQVEIAVKGSHALMTGITITDNTIITSDSVPLQMSVVYYPDSPYFQFSKDTMVSVVATYDATGHPAMIAFGYGDGKVFLSGPHPEIETDSNRDGSSINSHLPDDGSEWPLLLEVAKWMLAQ